LLNLEGLLDEARQAYKDLDYGIVEARTLEIKTIIENALNSK